MSSTKKSKLNSLAIVTLYKAFNHGAFLQAYALQKFLKEHNLNVSFIKVYDREHNFLAFKTLRPQKKYLIQSSIFNFSKLVTFLRHQKIFRISSVRNENFDAVILGSDEIWNIKNSSFIVKPEFFGLGINTKNLISYAPSAAKSTGFDIIKRSDLVEGLNQIHHISARDKNGLDIIKKATGQNGLRVVDPTFLTDIEEEQIDIGHDNFIAIYSYDLPIHLREEVMLFSRKKGLPLISVGFYAAWCDKSVNANPFQFMSILRRADHVITDTFHGTVLSVKLSKSLAVYAEGKEKIEDFLTSYSLESRIVNKASSLEQVLATPIDISSCTTLNDQLITSKRFLKTALAELIE